MAAKTILISLQSMDSKLEAEPTTVDWDIQDGLQNSRSDSFSYSYLNWLGYSYFNIGSLDKLGWMESEWMWMWMESEWVT